MSNFIHHQMIEQQKEKETKLNTMQYNTTKQKALTECRAYSLHPIK